MPRIVPPFVDPGLDCCRHWSDFAPSQQLAQSVAMARRALSATQVAALQQEGTHWVDRNLALQIKPQGARSWLFRYAGSGWALPAMCR